MDYLFSKRKYHKIGLDTYTFNEKMIYVAKKVGFIEEGIEREIRKWKSKWVNRINYGMLVNEYKNLKEKVSIEYE